MGTSAAQRQPLVVPFLFVVSSDPSAVSMCVDTICKGSDWLIIIVSAASFHRES